MRSSVVLSLSLMMLGLIAGCGGGSKSSGTPPPEITTAAPSFSPAGGTFTSAQTVTLSDSTAGATIYYTTDGTTPTNVSKVYSAPLTVAATTTINALAYATGDLDSSVVSATYTISLPAAAAPTFSPVAGTYTSAQSVSLADVTAGATIYYTIDGTTPTTASKTYSAPIVVAATTTIKAIAAASGFSPSAAASAVYTINIPVATTPVFTPAAGTYTSAQSVTLGDSTPNATIYYTMDGSAPTTSSKVYSAAISVPATATIKAIATATGYTTSAVGSATYTINLPAASAPTFSPVAGTYTSAQSVTLADTATGATIYYTTDGTTPTTSSTVYSAAIPVAATTTIKAIATAPDYTTSPVGSALFTINLPAAATPTFSPVAGTYATTQSVTLSDATTNASIYYTVDGTTPTTASTLYSAAISVTASGTIEAIATAANYTSSAVVSAAYVIGNAAPSATIAPNGGSFTSAQTVTLSDTLSSATLYYTLDGTTPTTASTKYTAPFTVNAAGSTTVKVLATGTGLTNSAVTSATFTLTFAANYQPTYSFKNVQIVGGGFVDGLYFHPKQKGLMYAHTDIGGAYRWNNVAGGDTQWVPLNDSNGAYNQGFDLGVQSLAIDPNDTTRLYLGVGDYTESYGHNGAILASSDMGKTFSISPLSIKLGGNDNGRNGGDRLQVDPNNGKHLYLGTILNGLYESNDRAATWSQISAFPITGVNPANAEDPESGVIFMQFVAGSGTVANGNTKTVYYGVTSPTKGIYISQDGGATFTTVPGQPTGYYPNAEALDAVNGILYVTYSLNSGCTQTTDNSCDHVGPGGPNAGQVWSYKLPTTSTPNGVWTNITPPQTTPSGGAYGWDSVVVDANHANVVMVTTLNKYYPFPQDDVFRSVDSGATWVNIGTNVVRDSSLSPWVLFGDATAGPGNWLNHLVVDPFDSNHVMYGDGQTIWETNDIGDADGVATSATVTNHGNKTTWTIGALGVEETVATALVSPPSGPAHLISQVGDLGGFTHLDLDVSPAAQMQMNPQFSTGTSVDVAWKSTQIVARVGNGNLTNNGASGIGGYSTDGGETWTPFATNPAALTSYGGKIAVAADGSTFVWMPSTQGVTPYYSTNHGTTWTASTGPAQTQYGQIAVFSDKANAKKLYLFDSSGTNGKAPVYVSLDGGKTFTLANTINSYGGAFAVSPNAEGDLWFGNYNGLYHSTNSGTTFTQVAGIAAGYGIGFGAAAPGAAYPAIYMVGAVSSDTGCTATTATTLDSLTQCVYRSVDGGTTFVRINDQAHQYGSWNLITGDPRVYGRVFFGTGGRGIIEADSPN